MQISAQSGARSSVPLRSARLSGSGAVMSLPSPIPTRRQYIQRTGKATVFRSSGAPVTPSGSAASCSKPLRMPAVLPQMRHGAKRRHLDNDGQAPSGYVESGPAPEMASWKRPSTAWLTLSVMLCEPAYREVSVIPRTRCRVHQVCTRDCLRQ